MQELALHIEYLLKRHDCVIVPGFGAFLASRRRAAYSPESVLPSSVEFFSIRRSATTTAFSQVLLPDATAFRLKKQDWCLPKSLNPCVWQSTVTERRQSAVWVFSAVGKKAPSPSIPLRSAQAYAEAIGMPPIGLAGITSDDETKKQEGEKKAAKPHANSALTATIT